MKTAKKKTGAKPKHTAQKKRRSVPKCVKALSVRLSDETCAGLREMFKKYGKCKTYFYHRFSGVRSMTAVKDRTALRNALRVEQKKLAEEGKPTYEQQFGVLNRHWVMALFEACANINTAWANLAGKIRSRLRDNSNVTDDERMYLFYILAARPIWQAVLLREEYKVPERLQAIEANVNQTRIPYLHNLLRRLTRKNKASVPKARNNTCMLLDEVMYTINEENGKTYISFMSIEKKALYKAELKGPYCYNRKGNIQLILKDNGRRVAIHKCIQARTRPSPGKNKEGFDKGLHTLLSGSNDKEFGIGFSELSNREADRIMQRNTNRNHLIQKHKDLRLELNRLKSEPCATDEIRSRLAEEQRLSFRIRRLEENNLGCRKYDREHHRAASHMESIINRTVKEAFTVSGVGIVAKEDLSFTREKGHDRSHSAKARARLSSWVKGTLNDRMEYIAEVNRIRIQDVNAAYTSQYCACCGSKLSGRTGAHHEVAICPVCGKINANTNAGKNIKARLTDKEITLYTPYKKVKQILDGRAPKGNPAVA